MLVGDPGARDGAVTFPLHRHGETFVFVSFFYSFIQQNFTKCFLPSWYAMFLFWCLSHSPFEVMIKITNIGNRGLIKTGSRQFLSEEETKRWTEGNIVSRCMVSGNVMPSLFPTCKPPQEY